MKSNSMKYFFLTLGFFALMFASPARAELNPYQKCLLSVSAENLKAKVAFQDGLFKMVTRERPDLGPLAGLSRDFQVAKARARTIKLDYLIESDVSRLVSASGLTRFVNFDWHREDEALLQSGNPQYEALLGEIELLGEENANHPDWPELRAFILSRSGQEDFLKLLRNMEAAQQKAGDKLENC